VHKHFALLLALTSFIVYIDGRTFYNERLNRACGFLAPAGLLFCLNKAVVVQFSECAMSGHMLVAYYVCAAAWATCGLGMLGVLSMDSLADVQSRVSPNTFIVVSGLIGIASVYLDCNMKPMYQLIVRIGIFYLITTSFVLLHSSSQRTHRMVYESVAKHITMHVLFVDVYVVAASVVLFIVFHVYVIQSRHSRKNSTGNQGSFYGVRVSSIAPTKNIEVAHATKIQSSESALNELLAAKRAINNV